jgi:DNA-binding beta-propeller fold protein YncE
MRAGPLRRLTQGVPLHLLLTLLATAPTAASEAPEILSARVFPLGTGGVTLLAPRGIAFHAARGEVLVANTGRGRIEIFDLDGRRRGHFVHRVPDGAGGLAPGLPVGLAVDGRGHALVVDNQDTAVDVLDFRGRSVARLALAAPGGASQTRAGAVAVSPTGDILVAAGGREGRVFRFDRDYRPLGCWGEPGTAPGHLSGITGLAVLPDGRVVVTCAQTEFAVQIFSEAGAYVAGFGVHDIGPGNFSLPSGVTTTRDGRIWVTDEIRQVIHTFDSDGRFLGMVGGGGVAPGQFRYPSALASDGEACLAVTERVGNRFQLLRARPAGASTTFTQPSPKGGSSPRHAGLHPIGPETRSIRTQEYRL